jgi:hypothetical protein
MQLRGTFQALSDGVGKRRPVKTTKRKPRVLRDLKALASKKGTR